MFVYEICFFVYFIYFFVVRTKVDFPDNVWDKNQKIERRRQTSQAPRLAGDCEIIIIQKEFRERTLAGGNRTNED